MASFLTYFLLMLEDPRCGSVLVKHRTHFRIYWYVFSSFTVVTGTRHILASSWGRDLNLTLPPRHATSTRMRMHACMRVCHLGLHAWLPLGACMRAWNEYLRGALARVSASSFQR